MGILEKSVSKVGQVEQVGSHPTRLLDEFSQGETRQDNEVGKIGDGYS